MPRSLSVLSLLALAGCSSLECGFGTVERDGACVQAVPPLECGAGTLQAGTECVATCGDGTVVSQDGLSCVAECEGGAVLNVQKNACVAECTDGAILNGAGTACVADIANLCDEGTFVSSDDTCVDWSGLLIDGAYEVVDSTDSETVVDDPFLFDLTFDCVDDIWGGTVCTATAGPRVGNAATPLTLPPAGETSVLSGNISLIGDLSGDGYEDVDWDVFAFEASAGDRLRITPSSTGDALPWFQLARFDDVPSGSSLTDTSLLPTIESWLAATGWERRHASWGSAMRARDVLIEQDGLYFMRVTDRDTVAMQFNFGDFNGDGDDEAQLVQTALPSGGNDYGYLIAVENLGPLDVSALETTTGRFLELGAGAAPIQIMGSRGDYGRVHDETYLLKTSDDSFGFAQLDINGYAGQPIGLFSAFHADLTGFVASFGLNGTGTALVPVPAGGVVMSHDFASWDSVADAGYDLMLSDPTVIQPNTATPMRFDAPGGFEVLVLRANAGDLVELSFDDFDSLLDPAVIIYRWDDEQGAWIVDGCGVSVNLGGSRVDNTQCSTSSTLFASVARYYETDTWVQVVVQDVMADPANTELDFTLRSSVFQPTVLSADGVTTTSASGSTGSLDAGDTEWVVLDLTVVDTNSNEATLAIAANDGSTGIDLAQWVQNDIESVVRTDIEVAPGASYGTLEYPTEDTTYLLRLAHRLGPASTASVDLTFGPPALPDISESSNPGFGIDLSGNGDDVYFEDYITIGDSCSVATLRVPMDMTHSWVGDLDIELWAPDGTYAVLQAADGNSSTDLIGVYPTTLTPADSLDVFQGVNSSGTWAVYVTDTYPGLDGGTWNSWGLDIVCE